MVATPSTLLSDPPVSAEDPDAAARAQPDLLSAFFSPLPVSQLATSLGLTIGELLDLYQSEAFQDQLAAIDELTQTRLRIQSAQARLTGIAALEALTKSAADPVEKRRAASHLIRATTFSRAVPPGDAEGDSRCERPRARHLPSRRLRAQQVAALISRALAENDSPAPDCGLATLHAFLSDDTRAASPHLADFIADAHDCSDEMHQGAPSASSGSSSDSLPDLEGLADLINHTGAVECSEPVQHNRNATVDVRLVPSEPNASESAPPSAQCLVPNAYRFHLTRPDTGPSRACWLIDRITRVESATGPPDGS